MVRAGHISALAASIGLPLQKGPILKNKFFLFLSLAMAVQLSFFSDAKAQNNGKIKTVQAGQFEKKVMKTDAPQLIDVRTPDEFAAGHLSGAVNHNLLDSSLHRAVEQLDRKRPVYVYCRTGVRSMKAAQILKSQGFKVYNLNGGITRWQEKGLPVVNY